MKPEEQRIAIAEACGITVYEEHDGSGLWSAKGPRWSSYKTGLDLEHAQRVSLPDYLGSLDAMWEAEELLTEGQTQRYILALSEVTKAVFETYIGPPARMHFNLYHATAPQRAEAFLRALNLWKP